MLNIIRLMVLLVFSISSITIIAVLKYVVNMFFGILAKGAAFVSYKRDKKYIDILQTDIYGIFYRAYGEIFYNVNFKGGTKIILFR